MKMIFSHAAICELILLGMSRMQHRQLSEMRLLVLLYFSFCFASSGSVVSADPINVGNLVTGSAPQNFVDLLTDNPEELQDSVLTVEGTIPDYVKGSLIRNGPAMWRGDLRYYAHLFDGAAKLTKYEIDGSTNTVRFTCRFLESQVYDNLQRGDILESISSGPVLDSQTDQPIVPAGIRDARFFLSSLYNTFFALDTCNVNIWDYDPRSNDGKLWAVTDIAATAEFRSATLETTRKGTSPPFPSNTGIFLGGTLATEYTLSAHPDYRKDGSGVTYNVDTILSASGPRIALILEDSALSRRSVVAQLTNLDDAWYPFQYGPPLFHSFGITATKALVVIQPIRVPVLQFTSMFRSGFFGASSTVPTTYLWVVDLETGRDVVQTVPDDIYFFHVASTTDEADGFASIRVVAYPSEDFLIGEDLFIRIDRTESLLGRNAISQRGRLVEIRTDCRSSSVESVQWFDFENLPGFEFPQHKYTRAIEYNLLQHPRYLYGVSFGAKNDGVFDNLALLKIDTETTRPGTAGALIPDVETFQEDSNYYSEGIFVADPNGTTEDSGVILSSAYDGKRRETYLLILDAVTMTEVARAYTGFQGKLDFHGQFFPTP